MLPQAKVNELLNLVKVLVATGTIDLPDPGLMTQLEVKSEDGRESFMIDVNRRGKIKVTKCTYQERYQVVEILLRLDVDGPPHENPDGEVIPCPHLHIYKEGFADKWAYAINTTDFNNTSDLAMTLVDFLRYCKVRDIPHVRSGLFS